MFLTLPRSSTTINCSKWIAFLALVSSCLILTQTVAAKSCGGGGNKHYHFSGKVQVEGRDLEGVQIRIVRKHSPVKWAQGPDAVTNDQGRFSVDCTFARDRNGVAPGGKKIRFKLMARLRNSEFKVRKGGWFKNNWLTIANERGCHRSGGLFTDACNDFTHDSIQKNFDTDTREGKLAQVWWFLNDLDDQLGDRGLALTDRPVFRRKLTITYPDRSVRQWYQDNILNEDTNSWYLFNVHLEQGDWNAEETMIHEYMHRWDVSNTKGSASLVCVFDKHHKAPDETGPAAKCSGFMEGFAEATAQKLNEHFYGGGSPELFTHWDLRTANADESYRVTNLDEAQRSDLGWQNFLAFLWKDNVWDGWGAADTDWCTPTQVSVFETLQAVQDEEPRKAKWLVSGNSTFEWFTGVLEKQISEFDEYDATFYELLGDPSLTASEIQDQMCNQSNATASTGLRGKVYERTADGGIGDPISNAEITFRSEDGSTTKNITTDSEGWYKASLPEGRYKGGVAHPNYQNEPAGQGYYIVEDEFSRTNFFLQPGGGSGASFPAWAGNFTIEYGFNRGGSDYRNFDLDRAEPRLCKKACAEDQRCRAFTYVEPGLQGDKARCWLKDNVPSRNMSSGVVSGVKQSASSSEPPFTVERAVNRGGSDYNNFTLDQAKPMLCQEACANDDRCASFTYVAPGIQGNKARCWLKDSVPGKNEIEKRVSGVKRGGN